MKRGPIGCVVYEGAIPDDLDDGESAPGVEVEVLNTVGAGDAFLSVTSLAAAIGVHPEVLGFIGNVAGAEAVEIVGNNEFIEKTKLKKHIVSLLK